MVRMGPGQVLAAGARVIGDAGSGVVWLDVCVISCHLPQMCRLAEVNELDTDVARANGLCVDCLGFGTLDNLVATIAPRLDQHLRAHLVNPCASCGGCGRSSIRVHVDDDDSFRMETLPHKPVPHGEMCAACGLRTDDPRAEHEDVTDE